MPDNEKTLPPVPKKRTRISLVWIIPIVAAAAGVWIAVTKILNQGPEITIVFSSADGLTANKTKISYNGLEVGTITGIKLADDHQHVIATARMNPKTKPFLCKDTKFWVVKPRMSGLSITGLGTLLSGYYIGVQLGQSKESARDFVALETPPLTGNVPGRIFTLRTPELGSLGEGTPIYFRQLPAGQVVSYELDPDAKFLDVKIFVQSPYDQYVCPDTRFWNASGMAVSLTASGLHVQTESLMSVLAGGIAFETPADDKPQPPADAGTTFTLFENRTEAFRPPTHDPHTYVIVFKQSVRGLEVGAPVIASGITIGEVTAINPQLDAQKDEFTVPVTITIDAARYGVRIFNLPPAENAADSNQRVMDDLVAHGLRAQLKNGNLISGALYVALDFHPDAPAVTLDWSRKPVELPALSGQMEAVEDTALNLMKSLDTTLGTVRGTLTNTDHLLNNASTLIEPDSELNAGLNGLLQQGGDAARAVRILADYLERHPEALIRGKTGENKQ
jgi:paraquat-inducible protein B